MKKFYHTLAIAAVAAVSLFTAQTANAQYIRNTPKSLVILGIENEDEPELTAVAEDIYTQAPTLDKQTYMDMLVDIKTKGTRVSPEKAQLLIEKGKDFGLTEEQVRAYIGNTIPLDSFVTIRLFRR